MDLDLVGSKDALSKYLKCIEYRFALPKKQLNPTEHVAFCTKKHNILHYMEGDIYLSITSVNAQLRHVVE